MKFDARLLIDFRKRVSAYVRATLQQKNGHIEFGRNAMGYDAAKKTGPDHNNSELAEAAHGDVNNDIGVGRAVLYFIPW